MVLLDDSRSLRSSGSVSQCLKPARKLGGRALRARFVHQTIFFSIKPFLSLSQLTKAFDLFIIIDHGYVYMNYISIIFITKTKIEMIKLRKMKHLKWEFL